MKLRRPWLWAIAYLAGWALLAVFFASQRVIYSAYSGKPVPWSTALNYPVVDCTVWAILTLGVFALARRFPFERGRMLRATALHLAAAALLFHPLAVLMTAYLYRVGGLTATMPMSPPALLRLMMVGRIHNNLMAYGVILGLTQTIGYYRRSRERELTAAQLEARLAETRLQVLQMQLHPHFLFNTLHAISALMHRDVEAADRMMAKLSDLLRMTLENAGDQEVPLAQELEFLQRYLEIQQVRFGDRLRFTLDVAPETLDALIPNLLLQPLVENAVRHGISARANGGAIELHARREDGRLHLTLRDDGPGLPSTGATGLREGVGLGNTRARLQALYGAHHRFELSNDSRGGLRVELDAPYRSRATNGAGRPGART